MKPTKFGIGAPMLRKEDARLITGTGNFLADIEVDNAASVAILRSPVAHADFRLLNLDEVRALPGVLDVITAEDIADLGPLPCIGNMENSDGSMPHVPPYAILPESRVRHVGEAVAFVVADTLENAQAAVEQIDFDYDELPCNVDTAAALEKDTPLIWPERGTNVAFDADHGDKAATDAAFGKAAHIITLDLVNNRVVTNYMEPRGAIGEYDDGTDKYTLSVSSQGVHLVQPIIAENVLGISKDQLRVVTPDVGGGFGTKYFAYREYALVLVAAKRIGRPVRWIGDRLEHFLADYHGRDNVSHAELALDENHNFLGIRADVTANMGAYLGQMAIYIVVNGVAMIPGCYRTPCAYVRTRGVYTNTVPVDAYRGAGRPEATYLIERLVDKAALELGVAPEDLRRKNFVQPDEMPFESPTMRTCDVGDFDQHMTAALELGDWDNFPKRAEADAAKGLLRGRGIATYVEACAGGGSEYANVILNTKGGATILIGTQASGQGHETAYSQLASEYLGIDPDMIDVVQGDTDRIIRGAGTGGSRSIPVGGSSVALSSERLAGRIRDAAGDVLEVAPGDIELVGGNVRIKGTDRFVPLGDIVAKLPEEERRTHEDWQPSAPTYPNGTHLVELVVDPDTGSIVIERFIVVDDFGVVLNPIMLDGQIHGGVVQGIGQAITERTIYDPENGQLLTASLMDYCLPRADDIPNIEIETRNIPSTTNALGMKGAGEAGAIGACPALVNAVVDALHRNFGITHIDMPMTPERVWQAIETARTNS